jgi:hypothetical protein
MRLLHCQYSINSQNRNWWGTHTVKCMFMCIEKEDKGTRSRINYDSVLLLKPKNVTVLNIIKWMVQNKIPIKISLIQTSTLISM